MFLLYADHYFFPAYAFRNILYLLYLIIIASKTYPERDFP